MRNGQVYRRRAPKHETGDVLQLLVPRAFRQDFLKKAHEGMTGGHLGVKRTMYQVQHRAFWPGWRSDVKRFCRQCQNCNGYFRGQLPRSAPLQPMLAGTPFEKLHFDLQLRNMEPMLVGATGRRGATQVVRSEWMDFHDLSFLPVTVGVPSRTNGVPDLM